MFWGYLERESGGLVYPECDPKGDGKGPEWAYCLLFSLWDGRCSRVSLPLAWSRGNTDGDEPERAQSNKISETGKQDEKAVTDLADTGSLTLEPTAEEEESAGLTMKSPKGLRWRFRDFQRWRSPIRKRLSKSWWDPCILFFCPYFWDNHRSLTPGNRPPFLTGMGKK